jgi:hypothetical protein
LKFTCVPVESIFSRIYLNFNEIENFFF